ncbi:autotransporter outer membrane beta-barrel domain-containing protein [Bradyrhizobium guangzhouense]|uniref:Autotransporter domain-containing protein n=1 Tax=Bradyrhizobium guangzhouense TaxID=1325095 RepID=A0AAE5X028_9BRAD|nr:autotransporter outer membrane beta-barrel domain-containing protein [Bradyrhizobium guangzhouense]QAU46412.1 hypothetical protein XH91_14260 [Bradyrhizobium guangzhouense]RXH07620.1 autotransporter domain-containing protein [Bradyrhizobium guangzhouense]
MKLKHAVPRPTMADRPCIARSLQRAAPLVLSVAGTIALQIAPASAACVQLGSTVTCSGATTTSFGTGTENNLALTVQPDASITVGAGVSAIQLNGSNTVLNNGTITVGNNSAAIQVSDNNIVTNAGAINSTALFSDGINALGNANTVTNSGTISLTGAAYGMFVNGSGNTVNNSGVIAVGSSANSGAVGVWMLTNNSLTNSGTITALGQGSAGVMFWGDGNTITNIGTISAANGAAVWMTGDNATIVNNGTIRGSGAGSFSLGTFGTGGTVVTNNGTLDGQMLFVGFGNTNALINNGLITITDPATPLFIGDLGVSGAFTQSAQGILALRIDNTGARDGLYGNTVNLNGTLRAVLQSGLYQSSTTYSNVVQSSSAIIGQFSNVATSSAFFNATATYNPTSVDLTLTRIGFGSVAGETANQRAVGSALEAGYSTALSGTAATFYSNLLQLGSVRVLDQLSGEGTSGTENSAFAAGTQFGQTMDGQMNAWRTGNRGSGPNGAALGYAEERSGGPMSAFAALKAPAMAQPLWNIWASGFGAAQSLSGNATIGSASLSDRVGGGSVGLDHLLNPDLLIGLAVGGSSASFSVNDRATSGRLDGGHVGAYAMQRFGTTYLSAQIAYSHFGNSTTRTITGIGADEIAKGSFGSDQLGGRFEIGRAFDYGALTATPYAAIQAAQLWQAAYTETSTAGAVPGVLGLNFAAHRVTSLPSFLGAKFDGRVDLGNGMVWSPFANLAWVHEFSPTRDVTATLVNMPAPSFTVEGARAASDTGRVELGSRLALNHWSELSGRVTGEFSRAGQSYAGIGSLRISW